MGPFGRERQAAIRALETGWITGALSIQTFEFRVERALRATHRERLARLVGDLSLPWAEPSRAVALGELPAHALIGRQPGVAVLLDDDTVSRHHAVLRRAGGHWTLRDLASLNGTTLNGRPLDSCERVEPGDRIGVGAVLLSVAP